MLVVDLFCGAGGFSTGAVEAGHQVVLAVDNWETALLAHQHNHPHAEHLNMELGGDLGEMEQIIRKTLSRYVDCNQWHLHGSPPCQNLSVANRTSGDATEGMRLVRWYLELVRLCQPNSWSMEQVIGAKQFLNANEFGQFHVLNTVDYSVPQTRKRLFLGDGWTLSQPVSEPVSLLQRFPYLKSEGVAYVKGYSNNRSVRGPDGTHLCNVPNHGLQGFRSVDEPTFTLCASGPLGLYSDQLKRIRQITVREALGIQGFPDSYEIPPTICKTKAFTLIGNAVSPAVAKSIMSHHLLYFLP